MLVVLAANGSWPGHSPAYLLSLLVLTLPAVAARTGFNAGLHLT